MGDMVRRVTTHRPMGGVGDVAASHHAILSKRQAVQSGMTLPQLRAEVDRQTLRRVAPNVMAIHGSPDSWQQRMMAATLTANQAGMGSHRSAARLHLVDGFEDDEHIELWVPRGRRILIPGAVVHQTNFLDDQWVEVEGIRCTSLAQTIVDLPQVVGPRRLERAIDSFQRMGHSLTWLEQVALRNRRPGHPGPKLVLAEIDARRQNGTVRGSWFEKLIEEVIASPRLPPMVQQYVIRGPAGEFIARVDLAFPGVRMGFEAHSRAFHTGTHMEIIDQRRENRAIEQGWLFIYLGWADRKTPKEALAFIERAVARRLRDLGLTVADLTTK